MVKMNKLDISAVFTVENVKKDSDGKCSYCYRYDSNRNRFVIGAFDGCASVKYEKLFGKSGAYIASRAVAGASLNWFGKSCDVSKFREYTDASLERCVSVCGKADDGDALCFETSASVITGSFGNELEIYAVWAGNSACFLLKPDGLYRLTADDMSYFSNDADVTNVISSEASYELHTRKINIKSPCILICACAGCFEGLESPADFEYLIVDSLIKANGIFGWKEYLRENISKAAKDDCTMTVAAFGYEDYDSLSTPFIKRYEYLESKFASEGADRMKFLEEYKADYCKYTDKATGK